VLVNTVDDVEYTVKGISRTLTISSKRDKVLFVTRERNLIIHEETYLKGFFELIVGNYLSAMFNRFAASLKAPSAIDVGSIS